MTEYVVRFLVGGVVVSAFAMLGDVLRPKSFAGLFGADRSARRSLHCTCMSRHGGHCDPVLLNCAVRPVSAPTICVAEAPIETWLKALLLDIIAAPVLAQLYR
jgi:hypothetical protein